MVNENSGVKTASMGQDPKTEAEYDTYVPDGTEKFFYAVIKVELDRFTKVMTVENVSKKISPVFDSAEMDMAKGIIEHLEKFS